MNTYDMSVVIPTFNRSYLLEKLLESLYIARENYKYGKTEVIVIDSSKGEELQRIKEACEKYDVRYLEGTDSVRQKRNIGIRSAQYPYIVFEDSDVVVDKDIFNYHAQTYMECAPEENVAGSFGLTIFTGEDNIVWKIIQYTTLTDSFSFAEKWPYQEWTIGNNVSFKKEVLEEVNMFEEAFPFKLGADDLDLSYRITHSGYRIKSQPKAVAYHSKDTWKKWKLVLERAKRWGRMEYYISKRHPQIFINRFPKTELIIPMMLLICGIVASVLRSWIPMIAFLVSTACISFATYLFDVIGSEKKNPIYYFIAKHLDFNYYYGHIFEGLKNRSLSGVYKQMSFSSGQTKMIMKKESRRMIMLFVNMVIMLAIIVFGA